MRRTVSIGVSLLGFFLLLTPQAVAQNKVVVIPLLGGKATGNATVDDVLKGKTFSNSSATGLTGTRPPAPVEKTGQTTSYSSGADGDLQRGVGWPNPRFTDNNDGTVTDELTGLIWLKNANCFGLRIWTMATEDANLLEDGSCGLSDGSIDGDWRLPNVRELQSLIDYGRFGSALPSGHPFTLVQSSFYWSSTTNAEYTSYAWYVSMRSGRVDSNLKASYNAYVWPVRSDN